MTHCVMHSTCLPAGSSKRVKNPTSARSTAAFCRACAPLRRGRGGKICAEFGLRRIFRGCTRPLDFSVRALPLGAIVLVSRRGSRPSQSWPEIGSSCRWASAASAQKGLGRRHRVRRWSPRIRHDAGEARASALRSGHVLPADRKQPLPSRGALERVGRRRSAGRELSFVHHQLP